MRASPRDPYAVLGLAPDADRAAIHAAYRRAVRRTHPDVGGTAAEFEAVQEAFEALRDPARRPAAAPRPRSSAPPPPSAPPGPGKPTAAGGFETQAMEDLLSESRRLEDEARLLAGLAPLDRGEPAGGGEGAGGAPADSLAAILDDAQRQLRDIAGELGRELRRQARRII